MEPDDAFDDEAARRRARAAQLRRSPTNTSSVDRPKAPEPEAGAPESKPVIDMTGPRLRLFAKSGEFPRAEQD